ncbi:MAG: hypothetical protein ABI574_13450 [Burkholderiales bacterium]
MTTVQITLPNKLAQEAEAAGLLTPAALREMVKDAMRRRAAQALLAGAARASDAGSQPWSMAEIQAEVASVRRERSAVRRGSSAKGSASKGPRTPAPTGSR